ncbi:hypothetical protein HCC61_03090 [Streptomyces sp. HNM0575]|nr:hypothetical protein [Streptomyces sp. HNM0575]
MLRDLSAYAFSLELSGVDETWSGGLTDEFRIAIGTFTKVASKALDPTTE